MAASQARCGEGHLGCTCRGDEAVHRQRLGEIAEARSRSQESVECPECGGATSPLAITAWGNCRACRTAHSRVHNPLRW